MISKNNDQSSSSLVLTPQVCTDPDTFWQSRAGAVFSQIILTMQEVCTAALDSAVTRLEEELTQTDKIQEWDAVYCRARQTVENRMIYNIRRRLQSEESQHIYVAERFGMEDEIDAEKEREQILWVINAPRMLTDCTEPGSRYLSLCMRYENRVSYALVMDLQETAFYYNCEGSRTMYAARDTLPEDGQILRNGTWGAARERIYVYSPAGERLSREEGEILAAFKKQYKEVILTPYAEDGIMAVAKGSAVAFYAPAIGSEHYMASMQIAYGAGRYCRAMNGWALCAANEEEGWKLGKCLEQNAKLTLFEAGQFEPVCCLKA